MALTPTHSSVLPSRLHQTTPAPFREASNSTMQTGGSEKENRGREKRVSSKWTKCSMALQRRMASLASADCRNEAFRSMHRWERQWRAPQNGRIRRHIILYRLPHDARRWAVFSFVGASKSMWRNP